MTIWNNWKLLLVACFTLGLAPFLPKQHIWGKLKWVTGGAVGMQPMDWLDTFFHTGCCGSTTCPVPSSIPPECAQVVEYEEIKSTKK